AQRSGKPVFDFGIGDPREPTPAFIREALKAAIPEVSQYPSVAGLPVLRKAAAGYLKRRFGLAVDPDREIMPCQGAKEALFHLPLTAVSREPGFLAVCDEPYVDLYAKEPPHTAYSVSRENVLVIHSLSKRSGMTGYRSGFMAGEPDLIAKLREARANFGVAPQSIVQQAAAVAWDDDAHVEERRKVF